MTMLPITGYASSMNVEAGSDISFFVSTGAQFFDARLVRLARRTDLFQPVDSAVEGRYAGKLQPIRMGSFGAIPDAGLDLPPDAEISISILPTRPGKGRTEGIMTWGGQNGLFLDGAGRLVFRWGGATLTLDQTLHRNHWYRVRVVFLPQLSRINFSMERQDAPHDRLKGELEAVSTIPLEAANFRLAGWFDGEKTTGCFNGKISQPTILSKSKSIAAKWDCAQAFETDRLVDAGPQGHHIRLFNHPRRAVTGPGWSGRFLDFTTRPSEYDAIAFHHDDMTDAGWAESLRWTVPKDFASDVYALEITCADGRDHIPFVVTPRRGGSDNKVLFLAPTFSYLAYANEQHWWTAPDIEQRTGKRLEDIISPGEKWVNELGMLSCYDRHADGTGCTHSSWRRPIVNFRADYVHPYLMGPHQLSADMYITDWLRAAGVGFDVITDHDLQREGEGILKSYDVVLSGSHPEYVSTEILDSLDSFIRQGGNFMYLGGNGFHCVSTVFPDAPHVIELRRGHSGGFHWKSGAGEDYHASTGEPGGPWRIRGRGTQRLFGVGFASVTFGEGEVYQRTEVSFDDGYQWMFRGISSETIGAKSDLLGGAAGFEYDRMDFALGSPPETVVLATARFAPAETEYTTLDSRWSGLPGENRSDIVIIERPESGSVFSVGSISWTAALFDCEGDNPVAQLTLNVLNKFRGVP